MNKDVEISDSIKNKIYPIRGVQIMLDSDLAALYNVETKNLNLAVKRNIERFPDNFRFQLTEKEYKSLRLQNETSKGKRGGRRYLPYAFTEQGVAMLSAVLRSKTAIEISIKIMQAFVEMKRFISTNADLFRRIERVEIKQLEADKKFEKLFKALESYEPKQGVFFNGQIFDAYTFVNKLIKKATRSIRLIDNYIDESVLVLFTKTPNINVQIYTKTNKRVKLDFEKYKKQYKNIEIINFELSHDRFLIIDDKELYHIGASLKDLGKKWFAFTKIEFGIKEILEKINKNDQ